MLAQDIRSITDKLAGGRCNRLIGEFEAYEKTASVSEKFRQAISFLGEVADTLDNAAKSDKQQAIDRGMKELGILCNRRVSELAKKGFTEVQIEKLLEDTPKPPGEHEHYLTTIKPLEDELEKLEAFLKDKPRYDQTLLVGTPFENWQPEPTEASIDQAAMVQLCRGHGVQADT